MSKFSKPTMPPLYKNVFENFSEIVRLRNFELKTSLRGYHMHFYSFYRQPVYKQPCMPLILKLPSPCRLGNKSRVSVTIHIQVQTLKKEDTKKIGLCQYSMLARIIR